MTQFAGEQRSIFDKLAFWSLFMSAAIALISVFGFKVFSLNPKLLVEMPWALSLYPYAYKFSAQLQIFLSAMALLCFLIARQTPFWPVTALVVYGLSFFSEFSGTSWGLPFGAYSYTDLLGPKIADKVPYLIPASWFFMGLASYRLALAAPQSLAHTFSARLWRILGGTLILVLWDVTLDPAMSYTTPFWVWEQSGRYYGMPLLNIAGWFLTGLGIMLVFELCPGPQNLARLPLRFILGLYLVNMILPIGLLAAVGAWLPIGLTLLLSVLLWGLSKIPAVLTPVTSYVYSTGR